jgi:hypothetical protein
MQLAGGGSKAIIASEETVDIVAAKSARQVVDVLIFAKQMKDLGDRWDALVRYDDEIRAAAEKLRSFGEAWVCRIS